MNALRAGLPWYLRWYVVPRVTREVATPEEATQATLELLAEEPDFLKITIDTDAIDAPLLDPATIAAITRVGHEAGVRSVVHVGDSAEAIRAVRGGADALAHSPWREELNDEAVAAIAKARVPVVATLAVWDLAGKPRTGEEEFLPIGSGVLTFAGTVEATERGFRRRAAARRTWRRRAFSSP